MKNDPKTPNLPCIRCHEKEARDGGAMCWDCTHAGTVNGIRPRKKPQNDGQTMRDESWTSIGYAKFRKNDTHTRTNDA